MGIPNLLDPLQDPSDEELASLMAAVGDAARARASDAQERLRAVLARQIETVIHELQSPARSIDREPARPLERGSGRG